MADPAQLSLSERLFTLLRILQAAMLVMTLFYVGLGEIVRGHRSGDQNSLYIALLAAAVSEAALIAFIRFSVLPKIEEALQLDSENKAALMGLRRWYVICFALSLGVAFYGLVLRIMGAPLQKASVFYAGGFLLILLCTPRKRA